MPTEKPRIQVTLSEDIYNYICEWAKDEKMSKSEVINYMINEYIEKKNGLAAEEQLIVNAYRYGNKEERKILWDAWQKVDEIVYKRRKEEQEKTIKNINIGRDNNGTINI